MTKQKGFTLVQLMTTMAIAGILSTVALPNFRQLHIQSKATANVNNLLNQLRFARDYALAHGRYVSICAIGNNQSCGQDWNRGLYVFFDSDADGKLAQADDIVREFPRQDATASLTLNAALNANFINYTPYGTSFRKYSGGNLVYCPQPGDAKLGKVIIYSAAGRAYVGQDSNNDGVPENGSNEAISC